MADVKPRKQYRRRGAALLEMAIVLGVLLLITMGAMEYGWYFLKASYVTNAARQGARVGVRADGTSANVDAAVLAAMTLGNMQSAAYTVTTIPAAAAGGPASLSPGQPFTVTVSVPYSGSGGVGLNMLIPPAVMPSVIRSKMVMSREGP